MTAAVLVFACASAAGCRHKEEAEATPVVTVDVAPVLLSSIQRTIRGEGVLYPRQQAAIVPKIAAPIHKAYVQRGARVRAGQLLLELENRDLAAESLRLTTLRYQAGESTALEVVDAQNTFVLARNAIDDAQVRYRVALAELQTLTGRF